MSATQARRMGAAPPVEDRYWEQVYARIRADQQTRRRGDPSTAEGRRRIEALARQRIIDLEDRGVRATDMTPAGLQVRTLRAKLNTVGARVPAQPRSRQLERMTLPARIRLR